MPISVNDLEAAYVKGLDLQNINKLILLLATPDVRNQVDPAAGQVLMALLTNSRFAKDCAPLRDAIITQLQQFVLTVEDELTTLGVATTKVML